MVHTSPPTGCKKVVPESAAPAHPLPPVGADGETRCPHPPARGRSPPTPSRRWGQMGKPGVPIPLRAGAARSLSPAGWRDGETRFPPPPARGRRPPPRAGGGRWGNPVSPSPCARAQPSHTFPPVGADGETRCPHPSARGRSPPTGRGYGRTWFPHAHVCQEHVFIIRLNVPFCHLSREGSCIVNTGTSGIIQGCGEATPPRASPRCHVAAGRRQ